MSKKTYPYIALILVCIIWGTTYMVNKIGVDQIPTFLFTSMRQLIAAGLLLGGLFIFGKHSIPERSHWIKQTGLGILLIGGGNGLGTFGLRYIDSGISSILASFNPILLAILTFFIKPDEKLSSSAWLGLCLGTTGIYLICYDKLSHPSHPLASVGISFTLISVLTWAIGSILSKKHKSLHSPFINAGIQMLSGGVFLFILYLFFEYPATVELNVERVFTWSYLIIFGSIVAYGCFIYALEHLPVSVVSLHTYINPIIAICIGAIILKESFSMTVLIGCVISLLGVYLVQRSYK